MAMVPESLIFARTVKRFASPSRRSQSNPSA